MGSLPQNIGHYRILDKLGQGGMGVVYVATDERLGRKVALKLLRADTADPNAKERLIREARLAASVSDPLICQVFELGEWQGQPFIAMELLAGEPLSARLTSGPLAPPEALRIAIAVVQALAVLHRHGIVHRDLKPSNIFVTAGSIKVLDFGLARPAAAETVLTSDEVTLAGTFAGTPRYAAPELLLGSPADARADQFSLGVILFEMLTGRPPFTGRTLGAVVQAVLRDTPAVLTGTAAMTELDRVIGRMLAKLPDDRFPGAEALAEELRRVLGLIENNPAAEARPIQRLAVLPFRLLKPDSEIDYLAMSLAAALAGSLSGLESLVVRSTLKSAKYAGAAPDLTAVATDLAVDVILTGSILRMNDRLRITAELVSVPDGEVRWTQTTQVSVDQVLELHDQLSQRVIQSLPLSVHDRTRKEAARPANTQAFDLYLRGMQLRMESSRWRQARAFFEQSLESDPQFAPAWAERGRLDRVLGKYEDCAHLASAESALMHALKIDPDNGVAQLYYAQLEIDLGRVASALSRLVRRALQRRAEPHIYAALVHACRYGGLLDESVMAHTQARRLDPMIPTSVLHTYYMRGDYPRALEEAHQSSDPLEARVLAAMGRNAEAVEAARREEQRFAAVPVLRSFSSGLRAALEGRREEALRAMEPFDAFGFTDGEALFYVAEVHAILNLPDAAFAMLRRAADAGFLCLPAFEHNPFLAPLRTQPAWTALLEAIKAKRRPVLEAFAEAGGPALTGSFA
jgi:non-specific serine/threonine protein kinase